MACLGLANRLWTCCKNKNGSSVLCRSTNCRCVSRKRSNVLVDSKVSRLVQNNFVPKPVIRHPIQIYIGEKWRGCWNSGAGAFTFAAVFQNYGSDPVAQLVEHLTFNQGVMGSSPIGITLQLLKSLYLNRLQGLFYWRCRLRCRFAPFGQFQTRFSRRLWHTFGLTANRAKFSPAFPSKSPLKLQLFGL